MMRLKQCMIVFLITLISLGHFAAQTFAQEDFSKPDELVLQSEATFKSFMADPKLEWMKSNVGSAKGIFIVPRMIRGGFFIGGSGGSGALFAKHRETGEWSYPAFYTMGSVSFGLQIGGDASEIILLVMTDKGMDAMLSREFKLGGDVSLAAGPVGEGHKAQTADVLAYARSKGAFMGVTVEGSVISPRDKWNNTYYGKEVDLVNILINQTVKNPQADNLRAALPAVK